ncbi:MAG: NADH-quinone oxidoreductase subunit N [Phycisphaerales bacterium]
MAEKLWLLIPELILFAGAVTAAVMGLSRERRVRDLLSPTVIGFLVVAGISVPIVHGSERGVEWSSALISPGLAGYVKLLTCFVGILLVMLGTGSVDRKMEADVAAGRVAFDPLRASRGEFHAFFLLSLIGVMLCSHATDLIWLFVALELTSLPTYIMVAISRPAKRAQEASMKYFFLGALAAAIFLYGFALIYGATGTVNLAELKAVLGGDGEFAGRALGPMGELGAVMVILGISFKIAAAPMHFYAADVYEGAASPVTAFLGFVPKTAGMVALMTLLSALDWTGPDGGPIATTLWMIAVLTMTLGNIGALLQRSVKRMLAYSSVAHSGYMIIGLLAGPGIGYAAILFYLFAYGLMNTGAFAVLSGLERQGREIESLDDLPGLRAKHPGMAWALALCSGSLLGFPPLLGFIGKLYLFIAGVQSGQVVLVVIAGLNSAISGYYYLQLIGLPILRGSTARSEAVQSTPSAWPRIAALVAAVSVTILPVFAQPLLRAGERAVGLDAGEADAGDASAAIPAEGDGAAATAADEAVATETPELIGEGSSAG